MQKQRDAHLEYRRGIGEVVDIFHGYQVKERELFPLIHTVSMSSCDRDNKPEVITAGAGDVVVVAMNCRASDAGYLVICMPVKDL